MSGTARAGWRRGLDRAMGLVGPLIALAAVMLFFALADRWFADGTFATWLNLRTVTVQTCVVAVAALGMTLIVISGGIDLSAGTALALCATTLAWGLREDVAFLVTHGDNFTRASHRLEDAQKKLATARRDESRLGSRNVQIQEARVESARQRLRSVLEVKRDKLTKGSAPSGNSVARAPGAAADPRAILEGKLERLTSDGPPLRVEPIWLEGVPNSPWTAPCAVMIGIATGILAGLLNGLLVSGLRIAPFVVTLGTMTILLGLGNLLSNNVPIRPSSAHTPSWLADLDGNTPNVLWLGFPTGVWLAGLLAIAVALVMGYTVFGRHLFALGSNEATARLCGIHVGRLKVAIYALGGMFFGVAGVFQFARLSTGNPMSGAGLELEIIAAVVIGGGSLSGGRGSVLGTLAGAAMTAVIKSGCTQLGLGDPLQRILLGVIIICAVVIDQLRQRRVASGL